MQPAPPCPVAPPFPIPGREWVAISGWDGSRGWIPRAVLEALGVDCSPLDKLVVYGWRSDLRQGTVWINAEQSAAMRRHPEWEPT